MKIFIFGSNGMLGNYVHSYLSEKYEIICLNRNEYDLSSLSYDSLDNLLINNKIEKDDIVINCAGVIPQSSRQRELNSRLYFTINSLFPIILSEICLENNAKMIHITTDCVFSGKEGNYDENCLHDETNEYGVSKSLGELCRACIIRTSIIGEEFNNKRSLLEWVRSNRDKEINGFTNHHWNGVTCLQLAKMINDMIYNKTYWEGVRNIFSPRTVSKYELVSMINEIYDLNIKINKMETEISIDKTIKSIYDNMFTVPDLYVQIEEMKSFTY